MITMMKQQQIKRNFLIFSCHCHYLYHQFDRNNRSICLSKYIGKKQIICVINVSNILYFLLYNSKRNSHEQSLFSLTSILNEYVINIDEHFLYILAIVNNDKQLKYWTKIQRLLKTKRNRLKVKYEDYYFQSIEIYLCFSDVCN
jgi:hypothetical protein